MDQDPQNEGKLYPLSHKDLLCDFKNSWGLPIKISIVVLKNSIWLLRKQRFEKVHFIRNTWKQNTWTNLFLVLLFSNFLFANTERVYISIFKLQ